jgi:hypothetical protein
MPPAEAVAESRPRPGENQAPPNAMTEGAPDAPQAEDAASPTETEPVVQAPPEELSPETEQSAAMPLSLPIEGDDLTPVSDQDGGAGPIESEDQDRSPQETIAPAQDETDPAGDIGRPWHERLVDSLRRVADVAEETQNQTERERKDEQQRSDDRETKREEAKPAQESQQPKQTPAEPTPPRPPVQPSNPGIEQAAQADKESEATSTIEALLEDLKSGKPLAARGLEIKTRRPEFTTLLQLTSRPGNPLTEIRFGGDGVPRLATILESSGDSRIDRAVQASLYRWRAEGELLDKLQGDQTANIRIRIILNPRVRQ